MLEHTSSGWWVRFSYTSTPNTENTHLRQESRCTLKEEDRKSTTVFSENKVGNKQKIKASRSRRHILCGQVLCGSTGRRLDHSTLEAGSTGLERGSRCWGSLAGSTSSHSCRGVTGQSREAPQSPASALWHQGGAVCGHM